MSFLVLSSRFSMLLQSVGEATLVSHAVLKQLISCLAGADDLHNYVIYLLHRWQFMLDLDGFLLDYQANRAKCFACSGAVCTCLFSHGCMMLDEIVECWKVIAILYDTVADMWGHQSSKLLTDNQQYTSCICRQI